jgi:RND superfamily putative drug exporter
MPNEQAVVRAVETAGRAVMLSGLTVAVGLIALVVIPVPSLRSTGFGGMLIPLVSIFVIVTLLPALLGGIGPRADWPRIRHEGHASRTWSAWARAIIRHRLPAAAIALVILIVALLPAFGLKVGETSASALAKTGSARVAYDELLAGGVPSGVLTPLEVLTKSSDTAAVMTKLRATTGISAAVLSHKTSPSDPQSYATSGTRGGLSDVIAIPSVETVNNASLAPVRAVQAGLVAVPGYLGVTGLGPIEQDYTHAVFSHFPLMFAFIALLTFLLLARAFRSVVLAAKAVILNLISLAATFGVLTWFWQEGHGSKLIFNIPATGAITFWIPLMVFAFLFGLSMDYEVFILSRIREEYDRTGSTAAAVIEGIGRTGRLVTSAALILFLAFASLASAPDTDIKVLATGLGVGILLDATVVRALLVPALVATFGKLNWWMPAPVARLLLLPKSELRTRSD